MVCSNVQYKIVQTREYVDPLNVKGRSVVRHVNDSKINELMLKLRAIVENSKSDEDKNKELTKAFTHTKITNDKFKEEVSRIKTELENIKTNGSDSNRIELTKKIVKDYFSEDRILVYRECNNDLNNPDYFVWKHILSSFGIRYNSCTYIQKQRIFGAALAGDASVTIVYLGDDIPPIVVSDLNSQVMVDALGRISMEILHKSLR